MISIPELGIGSDFLQSPGRVDYPFFLLTKLHSGDQRVQLIPKNKDDLQLRTRSRLRLESVNGLESLRAGNRASLFMDYQVGRTLHGGYRS